ncbi:uncharacterized protein [Diadema antillarum]|uniref:uncharacterized protein n=1 Tax=Diadema antillarum TaxID=105358 RepID=UPI003A87841F
MAVIGVCDSGQESSIKSLLHELRDLSSRSGGEVRFIQLPYSDLDSFELARGTVDGIILCHSIHNRRFSITDVDDALYDKFLPRMAETFGKNNVAVIVYDFPWHTHKGSEERSSIHHVRMDSFRIKQPTTFECSELAITCGRLDTTLEIDIEDRENLAVFLQNVQLRTREPRKLFTIQDMALAILFDTKAVIGVCDSGQESSIKSLLHELRDLSSRSGGEVRFIQLPYSDLDSFELARGTVDGIILCHSIHNRRFSITDVDDALYDKFLPCMAETYGKNNVAVIVYDFPWHTHRGSEERSSIHHVRMATFRIKQPTTFECSKLAITCGRLDTTLEIDIEDRENLAVFVQNVQPRRQPPLAVLLSPYMRRVAK